jgi:hypothetical protein
VPDVVDQKATTVNATYTLGSNAVTEAFGVLKVGDQWKIDQVVKQVDLTLVRQPSIPMRINGVKVTANTVTLLPGSYAFTTGQPYVNYGSKNVVLVRSPNASTNFFGIRSQLSSAGKKAAVAAAKKSYATCLKARSLKPKNCPNYSNSKYKYVKSTIRWSQTGKDPFRTAKVQLLAGVARVDINIKLKLSGSCTFEGRSGTCSGTLTGDARALASVLKRPVTVRWL